MVIWHPPYVSVTHGGDMGGVLNHHFNNFFSPISLFNQQKKAKITSTGWLLISPITKYKGLFHQGIFNHSFTPFMIIFKQKVP